MSVARFPPPDATREEIARWYAERQPKPGPAHEAPPMQGGPSPMCNACGKIRIRLQDVFCKGCLGGMEAAGLTPPSA